MIQTAVRKELHDFIDTMSDKSLETMRPLLFDIAKDEPPIIETDLTQEEHELIADTMKEYREHPETFATLESIIAKRPPKYAQKEYKEK